MLEVEKHTCNSPQKSQLEFSTTFMTLGIKSFTARLVTMNTYINVIHFCLESIVKDFYTVTDLLTKCSKIGLIYFTDD